jgi:hypothetical protein
MELDDAGNVVGPARLLSNDVCDVLLRLFCAK